MFMFFCVFDFEIFLLCISHVPALCASAKSDWVLAAVTDPDKNTSAMLFRKRLSGGTSSKSCPIARFDCIMEARLRTRTTHYNYI